VSDIVIGVDGGGSRTRVMLADEKGVELAVVEGAGSAVRPGEAEASATVIAQLVASVLEKANDRVDTTPRVLSVGVAGVGRPSERDALWRALEARELADEVIVDADAMIALEDAFGEGPGVLVSSGTGSVAFGRGPAGAFARCGGWGPVCGDEGSGAWIGRRALSVVTASADGREPESSLVGAILTFLQADTVEELIPWAATATPATLATLAPVVMSIAATGDQRASSLVALAVEELVLHVRTLARQLFGDERASVPVAFGGGLLAKGSLLRKRIEHRLKVAVPGAQPRAEEVIPVRGAVRAAIRALT
jgi:glucosamine kinase